MGFRGVECRVRLGVLGVELRGELEGRQEVRGCGEKWIIWGKRRLIHGHDGWIGVDTRIAKPCDAVEKRGTCS